MGTTQFDIIGRQIEAAARNAAAGAVGRLRRDTSLVNQASRLTGRTIRAGEEALRNKTRGSGGRRYSAPNGNTVETPPRPQYAAEDGYMRRSPVQPVHQAADYRRRLVLKGVGVVALIAVACAAVSLLLQLGIFGR